MQDDIASNYIDRLNKVADMEDAAKIREQPSRWVSVTTQEFTAKGNKGFWMFMLSPVVLGISSTIGVFTPEPGVATVAWLIFLVASITQLLGAIWMLIGRSMTTKSEIVQPAKPLAFSKAVTREMWA